MIVSFDHLYGLKNREGFTAEKESQNHSNRDNIVISPAPEMRLGHWDRSAHVTNVTKIPHQWLSVTGSGAWEGASALRWARCSVWSATVSVTNHPRSSEYYRVIKWSRHHYVKWIVLFVSVTSSSFSVNWFVNRWETMTFDKSHVCPLLNWYWRWHWKVLSYHAFMQIGDYRNSHRDYYKQSLLW